MTWLDQLGERGGSFPDAAKAFVSWRRAPSPLPRGAAAVRWLADTIDDFAHDAKAGEDDDARFVEGAGAFLGALLIDHLGGHHVARRSEHRVLLGDDGFFDPFGAIDAVLDAERTDDELHARLLAAESEARGEGPVARVVRAFRRALEASRPELSIRARFGLELELGDEIEVDLQRLAELGDAPGVLDGAAQRLVNLLPGGDAEAGVVPWADAEARLLPRLVGPKLLEGLGPRADAIWLSPFGHDVHVALQLRFEGRARYVRRDEETRWRDEGAEPFATALLALALRPPPKLVPLEDEGVVVARTGDGLDSARVLLPDVRDSLVDLLGPGTLVGVPHRDTFVAGTDRTRVARHVRESFARAPHGISEALFRLD
ncbi:MAG: hypothetical protein H6721_10845 [Sandaracinus sp.]|nr:hypothetical protein [Sandaracinus sp.]MCB9632617.1 hypothetical protein [Sandaracinus sp.]